MRKMTETIRYAIDVSSLGMLSSLPVQTRVLVDAGIGLNSRLDRTISMIDRNTRAV
jgi:hypothetical protein